jgi:hypothetical protein
MGKRRSRPLLPSQNQAHASCKSSFEIIRPYINSDTPAQAKHGSDTEVYNTIGDFDDDKFDYIFDMYSSDPHTHLTFPQGVRMLHGNMNPFDPVRSSIYYYDTSLTLVSQFGWIAAIFEWLATYILLYPLDKRGMAKADVKAVYNVSVAAMWASYFNLTWISH